MTKAPDLIKDAARRRAKRNKPEKNRLATYNRTVREIEELAHRGREVVATGQTIARAALRRSEAPLLRLKLSRRLNINEYTAADEILHAHAISQGISNVRDPDLGFGGGTIRTDAADAEAAHRIDTLDKFKEWRDELKQTDAYNAVMDIIIGEQSFTKAERKNRWRHGTAFHHLRDGLRHFAALRGNVPRGENWRLPSSRG